MPTELEQRLRDSLRQAARQFPPPPDLRDQVEARVASSGPPRRLAAAAAAIVLLVATLGVVRMDGQGDQRVRTGAGSPEEAQGQNARAVSLSHVPPGFGLGEDVEHRRPLGDRLRVMTWVRDDGGHRQAFEVHRRVGNPLDIAAELRMQPSSDATSVQGQPGVLIHDGDFVSMSWVAHDHVTLAVVSSDLPEPELRRVAEGIVYRPEHDAEPLPEEAYPVDPGDGNRQLRPTTVVAQGQVDGIPWELVAYSSDSGLCVDLRLGRGSGGGCGHDIGPDRAVNVGITSSHGGFRFAQGVARKDVAAVRIELSNGDILDLQTTNLSSFEVNFLATPLPDDAVIETVVALDGNGEVVQELAGPL